MAIIKAVSLEELQNKFTKKLSVFYSGTDEDVAFLAAIVKEKDFQKNPLDFLGVPIPRVPAGKLCLTNDLSLNKRTLFLIDDPFSRCGWGFAYWRYFAPVRTKERILLLKSCTVKFPD